MTALKHMLSLVFYALIYYLELTVSYYGDIFFDLSYTLPMRRHHDL